MNSGLLDYQDVRFSGCTPTFLTNILTPAIHSQKDTLHYNLEEHHLQSALNIFMNIFWFVTVIPKEMDVTHFLRSYIHFNNTD
jgi:hypothetical protein